MLIIDILTVLLLLFLVATTNGQQESMDEVHEIEVDHWNQNRQAMVYLTKIRAQASNMASTKRLKPCHYFPIDARNEYFKGTWQQLLPQSHFEYIHYYSPCMSSYNLGNNLGNYFNELACAVATNTSIVIGKKLWDYPTMPFEYKGQNRGGPAMGRGVLAQHNLALFENLPDVFDPANSYISSIFCESPVTCIARMKRSHAELVALTKEVCPCDKYCWGDANAPWVHHYQ